MSKGIAFLMYHELGAADRRLCDESPGYRRYVVAEDSFKNQLAMIESNGWRGWNVSEALRAMGNQREGVCLTFDDGCATDRSIAAPLLLEKKFNATFYITVNHLEKRGYLTRTELRELATLGFEIGSHSLNHRYLGDLSIDDLKVELGESKKQLEDITGVGVEHFSCPGGRVNPLVEKMARETGYQSLATSRIGLNTAMTDNFRLARIAVKEGTTTMNLARLCRGEGLFLSQAQDVALSAAKRLLGNSIYERVRAGALR
jgi:peptidoglycan/xylan/chitin deacetylase (PgdA/CDA1 family)